MTKRVAAAPKPLRSRPARRGSAVWRIAAGLLLWLLVLAATALDRVPYGITLYYLGAGLVSAFAYWLDKRAAIAGRWRISEATLHSLDFFGGIIGGLVAQVRFRHKIAKPRYGTTTAAIAVLHAAALSALVSGLARAPWIS